MRPLTEHTLIQEFERHYKRLYSVVFRMTENTHDTEDILQNVFLKAYKNSSGFRGDAKPSTWLYRIAVNESSTYLKSWNRLPIVTITEERDCSEEEFFASIAYDQSEHDRISMDEMREKCLGGFLRCVPKNMRVVFLLKSCLEMRIKEIAEVMEMTESNVKVLLHRARKQLQEMFEFRCSLIDPEKPCKCVLWVKFMRDNNLQIPAGGIDYRDRALEQEHFRNMKLMHKIEYLYRVEHQFTYAQFMQRLRKMKEIL